MTRLSNLLTTPCILTEAQARVFGEVTEDNDRIYALSETPYWSRHAHFPVTLQLWGSGHWCRCDGQRSHFADETEARAAGQRWIETGTTHHRATSEEEN